jgi:MFS family permease
MFERMATKSAFEQSRPLLLTSFTNKMGSIGLSLIAILLVDKGVTTAQGSFVLAALKAMIVTGTLVGGALSDRVGPRTLVLAAFLLSAVGLGGLPFGGTVAVILAFGLLAQFAESVINVGQRLLLTQEVSEENHKEALGWLRMVNNAAQIVTFSVAALASRLGVAPLMLLDASTSLGAFILGRRLLSPDEGPAERPDAPKPGGAPASKVVFFGCALVFLGWSLFYELFVEGISGRLEALHPGEGLRRFSLIMILNTVLCAALAVRATKAFPRSFTAIAGGLALTACGILAAAWRTSSMAWVFFGMGLLTAGELMLGAVAQYTLIRLAPGGRNSGTYYSFGLTFMQCGRILGAAGAFPLLVHAQGLERLSGLVLGLTSALMLVLFALKGEIERRV